MGDRSSAFHFSIAWTLEPPDDDLLKVTEAASNQMHEAHKISVKVEDVKAKIGNVITSIPLLSKAVESKGLFGI